MGNGLGTLGPCFAGDGRPVGAAAGNGTLMGVDANEESLGHSFVYVRPDGPQGLPRSFSSASSSSRVHHSDEAVAPVPATTFRSISGAAVSANAATPLSTAPLLLRSDLACSSAASFESSSSFASIALQMPPRYSGSFSGPLTDRPCNSGPLSDRGGFASGHLDRGFHSGPLDHQRSVGGLLFSSGRLDDPSSSSSSSVSKRRAFRRTERSRRTGPSFLRDLTKAISRTATKLRSIASTNKSSGKSNGSKGHDVNGNHDSTIDPRLRSAANGDDGIKMDRSGEESDSLDAQNGNLHWAQGKAGEDRVHVVISEEHGWVFVGIYDGFNGPDATDYLLTNLYQAVHRELKGLLWDDSANEHEHSDDSSQELDDDCCEEGRQRQSSSPAARKRRKSKLELDTERTEMDRRLKEQFRRAAMGGAVDHREVLKALSRALRKTEEAFLGLTDKMIPVNPELSLMGSCVLVVLMRGEDVFLMNVGDSRAVLARRAESDLWNLVGKATQDLDLIRDETLRYLEAYEDGDLLAVQLTMDHSTCVDEEVRRIRSEHPDDPSAIANNRVKGSLKVTRAFGAGYLKQPKLNNALLPVFRIDYKGALPYISCSPFLCHHRLVPKDKYLILSSDGLYQYFTNEEVVTEVDMFISMNPEGDPAQYLVEEVLNRAAREAGMDFQQLLEIPQGVRRKYHDDVSIIVISLEGRIWRSRV